MAQKEPKHSAWAEEQSLPEPHSSSPSPRTEAQVFRKQMVWEPGEEEKEVEESGMEKERKEEKEREEAEEEDREEGEEEKEGKEKEVTEEREEAEEGREVHWEEEALLSSLLLPQS